MPTPIQISQQPSVTFVLPQALYNEYVHFKETEIPAKEVEKGHIEHLYKLLEVSEGSLHDWGLLRKADCRNGRVYTCRKTDCIWYSSVRIYCVLVWLKVFAVNNAENCLVENITVVALSLLS